jgi:hypothetical protein
MILKSLTFSNPAHPFIGVIGIQTKENGKTCEARRAGKINCLNHDSLDSRINMIVQQFKSWFRQQQRRLL